MFADPPMTGPSVVASKFLMILQQICLLTISMSRHCTNYEINHCCKMYDPSNVLDDVSHDDNRYPLAQSSGAQIPKDIKVILHQSTRPPQYQPCVCMTTSAEIPLSLVSPVMEWRSPLAPSDHGILKARTPINKGLKVRRSLIVEPSAPVSPARRKNRQIAASSTMAVRIKAKYDPIGAKDSQQEKVERHLLLNMEYRVHQLHSLGFPMFGELGGAPDGPGDM